jgi:hypothetical protein
VKAEAAAASEAVPFFIDFFDFLEVLLVSSDSTLRFDRFSVLSDAAIVFSCDVHRTSTGLWNFLRACRLSRMTLIITIVPIRQSSPSSNFSQGPNATIPATVLKSAGAKGIINAQLCCTVRTCTWESGHEVLWFAAM